MAVPVRKLLTVAGWSRGGLLGALGGRQVICSACFLHQSPQAQGRSKAKRARFERNERLRANRRDPELERLTRSRQLLVPLSLAKAEREAHGGRRQLQTAGLHYAIYRDVYGSMVRPQGLMGVEYEGGSNVERGNVISPAEAASVPVVSLPKDLPKSHLCSLVLSNPDGHLTGTNQELLHWMVVNIRDGDLTTGETVYPYLPPIPPRGTGFHRIVFSVYSHPSPLLSSGLRKGGQNWLEDRNFSTPDFLVTHEVQPYTFCFYQSQWDQSVHDTYMNVLGYPEPVYDLEKPPNRRKQRQAEIRAKRSNRYRNM